PPHPQRGPPRRLARPHPPGPAPPAQPLPVRAAAAVPALTPARIAQDPLLPRRHGPPRRGVPLLLGEATPDPVPLVVVQGMGQARVAHRPHPADTLCVLLPLRPVRGLLPLRSEPHVQADTRAGSLVLPPPHGVVHQALRRMPRPSGRGGIRPPEGVARRSRDSPKREALKTFSFRLPIRQRNRS